jgi:hypothetical protein
MRMELVMNLHGRAVKRCKVRLAVKAFEGIPQNQLPSQPSNKSRQRQRREIKGRSA